MVEYLIERWCEIVHTINGFDLMVAVVSFILGYTFKRPKRRERSYR